jgi:hypothetical protein
MDLRLKNAGPDDGIFSITPNLTDVIAITPAAGRVKVSEHTDVQVRVKLIKPGSFEIPVSVAVCGSSPLGFTITGQAELPRAALTVETNLTYGIVYVGGKDTRSLTLRNTGAIPVIGFLDFSRHPDFHLEFKSELGQPGVDEHSDSIALVTDIRQSLSRSDSTPSLPSVGESQAVGFMYRITVIEGSAVSFGIVYQPRKVDQWSLELPLSIPNLVEDPKSIRPLLEGSSLQAPLFLSESAINFGVCPLYDAENPNNRPPLRQLVLKNEYIKDVSFRIMLSGTSVFSVEPLNGKIKYATTTTVFITFRPNQSQPFNVFIPIYVITDVGESLVSQVQLSGIGSARMLVPSATYVSLPVVPLGMRSEMMIRVLNAGSIRADLKVDMPILEKHFPLTVTFP